VGLGALALGWPFLPHRVIRVLVFWGLVTGCDRPGAVQDRVEAEESDHDRQRHAGPQQDGEAER
jgi:hypothetical protein